MAWLRRFLQWSVKQPLFLVLALVLAGFTSYTLISKPAPVASDPAALSSEYAFFNTSPLGTAGGLAVPASCPSDLHDDPTYGQACCNCNSYGCNCSTFQCGGVCPAPYPSCSPDNSCAALTCSGQSCTNNCGQSIPGTHPGNWYGVSGNCTNLGYSGGTYTYEANSCTGATRNQNTSGCVSCTSCTSAPNACGWTNSGTNCGGGCSAGTPPNPPNLGNGCQSGSNSCGMRNSGTIDCNGNCNASPPSDSLCGPVCVPNQGQSCGNACNGGSIDCNGNCTAPAPPGNYGNSCQSASNSCGMTNWGTINCSGNCSAGPPSDSACASCPNGSCGGGESCFSCAADCGQAGNTGSGCSSPANSCGMTNGGTILCDGSCSAGGPPGDWLCPPVEICGNGVREGSEDCDTGGNRGSCPAACSNSCNWNSCGGGGTNGDCGWANGGSYSSAPSGGLCNAGSASSPYSGGGFWNWTCSGSGGGGDASCWAFDDPGQVCGNGIQEGSEQCDNGGSNGSCPSGCSNSCNFNSCSGPINGSCSSFHYGCNSGTSTNASDQPTQWTWTCQGSNGGGNAFCSESKGLPAPQCNFSHYNCDSGASSGGYDGGAAWFWWCTTPGFGDAFCSEPKPAPSGSITFNGCTIPVGGSSCGASVNWSTSYANSVTVTINTSPQINFGGWSGNSPITINGPGTYTADLFDNGSNLLDSATINVSCGGGAQWNGSACLMAPTVDLKVSVDGGPFQDGPVDARLGSRLVFSWATNHTDASTTCTATQLWGGNKTPVTGGTANEFAFADGDYELECTKSGLSGSDIVHINISCTPECGGWSVCSPPCAGGNGTQTRECINAKCLPYTSAPRACTTTTCRDINWKEIGQ